VYEKIYNSLFFRLKDDEIAKIVILAFQYINFSATEPFHPSQQFICEHPGHLTDRKFAG
jgi:hypothetical protein